MQSWFLIEKMSLFAEEKRDFRERSPSQITKWWWYNGFHLSEELPCRSRIPSSVKLLDLIPFGHMDMDLCLRHI